MKLSPIKNWIKKTYWDATRTPWVATIHGVDRVSNLVKREYTQEDSRAKADIVEYYKDNILVHRSVNIAIKQSINLAEARAGKLGA